MIAADYLLQCAVYNTATTPAHLAGIEYIITSDAFENLTMEGSCANRVWTKGSTMG